MATPDVLYLKGADMVLYYDVRRLRQILSDTGLQIDESAIATDPNLLAGINSACADINSRCYQGKRYTPEQLQDLIKNKDVSVQTKMAATALEQLTADLAFGFIVGRRGYGPDVLERLAPRYKSALETLERLYLGEKVFHIDTAIEAGVPHVVRIGGNGYLPSAENKLFGIWRDTPGYYGIDPRNRWY